MSVAVIPIVLDVGYIDDSQVRATVMRNRYMTPQGRVFQKITSSGRYVAGVVNYIFKDALTENPAGGTWNRWTRFSNLWNAMQQGDYACLFIDTNEFTLTDEPIGTGDDSTATFQILKVSTPLAGYSVRRKITRPIHNWGTTGKPDRLYFHNLLDPADGLPGLINTITVKVDGVAETHFTVDETTGVITFAMGYIPAAGKAITVSGYFVIPILFEDDTMPKDLDGPAIKITGLRIRELPQDN